MVPTNASPSQVRNSRTTNPQARSLRLAPPLLGHEHPTHPALPSLPRHKTQRPRLQQKDLVRAHGQDMHRRSAEDRGDTTANGRGRHALESYGL